MFMLEGMDDMPLPIRHLQASDQESDADGILYFFFHFRTVLLN